jgi:hypothetical protein
MRSVISVDDKCHALPGSYGSHGSYGGYGSHGIGPVLGVSGV